MPSEAASEESGDQERQLVHQRNDSFFRGYFKHPPIAQPLLEWKLPPNLAMAYSMDALELAPNSYIDDDLRPFASDLLWKAKSATGESWIYTLWEHQSNPYAFMPLRCLRYLTGAWMDFLKSGKRRRAEKLPPAIAVVLYQGTQEWTQPTRFRQMVEFGPVAEEHFGDYVPEFEVVLVPLDQIPEEELPQSKLCFLGLTLMQAAVRGEAIEWLEAKQDILVEVLRENGVDSSFIQMLSYVSQSVPDEKVPQLRDEIAELEKLSLTNMKTAYDVFTEEAQKRGFEKGMERGQQSIIRSMAEKGLSAEEIAKLTDLPVESVRKILEAGS